jgi:hypothetical protein
MNIKQMVLCTSAVMLLFLPACRGEPADQQTFTGKVMAGAQLGEVKNYCAEGLYLVAEEGYLVDQTQMLLLKVADGADGSSMLSDQQYVGQKVEVIGKYPAQEVFCEALLCACEDYILVERIQIAR